MSTCLSINVPDDHIARSPRHREHFLMRNVFMLTRTSGLLLCDYIAAIFQQQVFVIIFLFDLASRYFDVSVRCKY